MNNTTIKLTNDELKLMNQIFDAIEALSNDKLFVKKLKVAYDMKDEDITEENEDDFMQLINFKDNINDLVRDSLP